MLRYAKQNSTVQSTSPPTCQFHCWSFLFHFLAHSLSIRWSHSLYIWFPFVRSRSFASLRIHCDIMHYHFCASKNWRFGLNILIKMYLTRYLSKERGICLLKVCHCMYRVCVSVCVCQTLSFDAMFSTAQLPSLWNSFNLFVMNSTTHKTTFSLSLPSSLLILPRYKYIIR